MLKTSYEGSYLKVKFILIIVLIDFSNTLK